MPVTISENEKMPVLGLMAGTSVDGIDASIIMTDGVTANTSRQHGQFPYRPETKAAIFAAMGDPHPHPHPSPHPSHDTLATMIADDHAQAVLGLIDRTGIKPHLLGFHGQTIFHDPARGVSLQIGDARHLAQITGLPVAYDFRQADLKAGGQGAPLAPVYHQALLTSLDLPLPCALVNIGGISNISIWDGEVVSGFDTGPGNGLMDQLARESLGQDCDQDGRLAASGTPDEDWVSTVMKLPYFSATGPKSLDRQHLFDWCSIHAPPEDIADRMASFALLTAASVVSACRNMAHIIITGGGARNPYLLKIIQHQASCPVTTMDDHGGDGDFLEAELMAFLAARVLRDLPLTYPETTGARHPTCGGVIITP